MLALSIDLTIVKLRTATIQIHRANAGQVNQPASDRINVYYPFIDHVIEQLNTRFCSEHQEIIAADCLIHKTCISLVMTKLL